MCTEKYSKLFLLHLYIYIYIYTFIKKICRSNILKYVKIFVGEAESETAPTNAVAEPAGSKPRLGPHFRLLATKTRRPVKAVNDLSP